MSCAPIKLYYFDGVGKAQSIRYALEAGKIAYEDVRFTKQEWADTFKAKSPSGQCPFFEFADGTMMVESLAMLMYACQKGGKGMVPTCPKALGCGMMMIQMAEDVIGGLKKAYSMTPEEREKAADEMKTAMVEKIANIHKEYKKMFPKAESFLFGSEPTFADFYLAALVENMTTANPFPELKMDPEVAKTKFPEFAAAAFAVWSIPEVKAMNDKHKK